MLLYHILPGATPTTELTEGETNTLFTGNQVDVGIRPTRFDDATVVTPDIVACNGYINVIDGVLNPFPNPICADYTFDRRVRRLQDEGENCNDNVLYTARLNPDLAVVTGLIELAELDPIFSCAGKVMMICFVASVLSFKPQYSCLVRRCIHCPFSNKCSVRRVGSSGPERAIITREQGNPAEFLALSHSAGCYPHYWIHYWTHRHIIHRQSS